MKSSEEIQKAFELLSTEAGIVEFLANRLCMTQDRAARIHRLGHPWPLPIPKDQSITAHYHELFLSGTKAEQEGNNPIMALNGFKQFSDMKMEVRTGERTEFEEVRPPEECLDSLTWVARYPEVAAHLHKVVNLSGETRETLEEFYIAEMVLLQKLNTLLLQLCQAITQEKG